MNCNKLNDRPKDISRAPMELNAGHALGTWVNTDQSTGEIGQLRIEQRDGNLWVRAFGVTESGLNELGEAPINAYTSSLESADLSGFTAKFDFGWSELLFVVNIKLGVLVLQSYNGFLDDSLRRPFYKREFFYRSGIPEEVSHSQTSDVYLVGAPHEPTPDIDLCRYLGNWSNTNVQTRWVRRIVLSRTETGYEVEAFGATSPANWGRVPIYIYRGNLGEGAFRADFQTDQFESVWSVNMPHDLIVVAGFHEVKLGPDAGRYFWREFFNHERAQRLAREAE